MATITDGKIFLLQGDNTLQTLTEAPYESEDLLQTLLEKYPDLLAGDQIDRAEPRRWLLVSREYGVPGEEEGPDRWSLDHLFLDQDAVPTLVEVKRSSDTRIRREVVGQMLDYAANAVVYWPVERMRERFERRWEAGDETADTRLAEFLGVSQGDQEAIEKFWKQVESNLQAGHIRMVFVADVIPDELRRVVEFLNKQMTLSEVLAVEVRQFVGEGLKTLVPRVMGMTAEAETKKRGSSAVARDWDEGSFFALLTEKRGAAEAAVARKILDWATNQGLRVRWGKGGQNGAFVVSVDHKGVDHTFAVPSTLGYVEIRFGYIKRQAPFSDPALRGELLERFNRIPGVSLPSDAVDRFPSIRFMLLQDEAAIAQFLETLEWYVTQVQAS